MVHSVYIPLRTIIQFCRYVRIGPKKDFVISKYPTLCPDDLMEVQACIDIGLRCVEVDQYRRPSIVEIVDRLQGRRSF